MKARRIIHEADVVVYDRLVGSEILDLARKEAKFISVGKKGFGPAVSQQSINAHLVREASRGLLVVRLKGVIPGYLGVSMKSLSTSRLLALPQRLCPV